MALARAPPDQHRHAPPKGTTSSTSGPRTLVSRGWHPEIRNAEYIAAHRLRVTLVSSATTRRYGVPGQQRVVFMGSRTTRRSGTAGGAPTPGAPTGRARM
ncbi:hypothetical protein FAIPA1_60031 [Frankia sp. AiPs1]